MASSNVKPTLNLAAIVTTFHNFRRTIPTLAISPTNKFAVGVSVGVGIVILGILTRYFGQKKRSCPSKTGNKREKNRLPTLIPNALKDLNSLDECASRPRSPSIRSIRRQGSVLSGISSASEVGRPDYRKNLTHEQGNAFTPPQLGVMEYTCIKRVLRMHSTL